MNYSDPLAWATYLAHFGCSPNIPPPPPEIYADCEGEVLEGNLRFWVARADPTREEERRAMHKHLCRELQRRESAF